MDNSQLVNNSRICKFPIYCLYTLNVEVIHDLFNYELDNKIDMSYTFL